MSRQASLNISISQSHQDKPDLFPLLMNSGRLLLIFVITLFLTILLASGHVTAEMLFQSPTEQPPTEQPPTEQPPTEQPPTEQPPTEQPPTEQPATEQPATEQPPAEQPTAEQPTAEQPPAEQPPTEQPATQPQEQPTDQAPLSAEPLPPVGGADEEFPEDDAEPSELVLDEAELIDSIVVSGAYIWLCCGVILFLLIPLSLLFLYIRGRSKIAQEEDF